MAPHIDCEELYERLGEDELLVVDCREEAEWRLYAVHLPGALRIPLSQISEAASALPDDELIVVCGADPSGADAALAARQLLPRGLQAVYLEGGIQAWVSAGLPVEPHGAGAELSDVSSADSQADPA